MLIKHIPMAITNITGTYSNKDKQTNFFFELFLHNDMSHTRVFLCGLMINDGKLVHVEFMIKTI